MARLRRILCWLLGHRWFVCPDHQVMQRVHLGQPLVTCDRCGRDQP